MKYIKIFIISIIVFHFSLVGIGQLRDLGFLKNSFVDKVNEMYVIPFFEQSWSMFSPNPPVGNQYFIVKFKADKDSLTVDIHEQIRKGSVFSFLNINQRLLKYQNECYNNILIGLESGRISPSNTIIHNNHGVESILNYSKITLQKQTDFLSDISLNDSIKIDLYLIDETLNEPNSSNKFKEKKYIQLDNLFLMTKNELQK